MSKIVKEKIDTHAVIVDTNILFHEDKAYVVDPKFDKFWEEYAEEANLELFLPDVVIGEILYQQSSSALTTLQRANDSIDRLTSFTGKKYGHRVTDKRVKNEIKSRFNKWMNQKCIVLLKTPTDNIDWQRLINDAVWRKPPFSQESKKDKSEKGFRDSLILETVVDYCQTEVERQIVFITNDSLLREEAKKRLKTDTTVSTYSSLEEFESYIKLQKEHLEHGFVKSIINKAATKFFQFKNRNSLAYKTALHNVLTEEHKEFIENPGSILDENQEDEFLSDDEWRAKSRGLFKVVGKPQFQHIENEHTFIWVSKVAYNQEFERYSDWEEETITYALELFFDVKWKSNISMKSRFTKVDLIDTECTSAEFTPEYG